jgi:hypothetical protein
MANICLSTLLNHIDNLLNKIFFWEGGAMEVLRPDHFTIRIIKLTHDKLTISKIPDHHIEDNI